MRLLALLLALAPLSLAWSKPLDVPLSIDGRHLQQQLAEVLGLDARGRGQRVADDCNFLDIQSLAVTSHGPVLQLSIDMTVHAGTEVFGQCRGSGPLDSQLSLQLDPQLAPGGTAVLFHASGAELRGPQGGRSLLSRPSRVLADSLILPRIAALRIDVSEPLAAIDQLIEDFLPTSRAAPSPLAERGRLSAVSVTDDGLRAMLRFQLNPQNLAEAPPEATLDTSELAQWQRIEDELDGFLTVIIARLATQASDRDQQLELLAVLLNARHSIAEALAKDGPGDDPVRVLFLQAWSALRPLLADIELADVADDVDLRLAGFLAAGDALEVMDALGPEYGIVINRDGLRRLARLLLADQAPARFTPLPLASDPQLQRLFGLAGKPAQSQLATKPQRSLLDWLIPAAHAESLPDGSALAEALRYVVPRLAGLDDYLKLVDRLLEATIDSHLSEATRVPTKYRDLFDPLVRATAWKESCWRHYVGSADEPTVIRSAVGAVGMMQIMGRVWRGVYDVERLETEVDYNIAAGTEILEHYLVDYAIRRGEHEQPGGRENLVRATYAAYNGGPSHLRRYRNPETPSRLRAIDNAFWRDFEQMRAEQWPNVAGCYSVGE